MTENNAKRFRFQMGDGDDDEWYQIQWNAVAFGIYNILYICYDYFVARCSLLVAADTLWHGKRKGKQIK